MKRPIVVLALAFAFAAAGCRGGMTDEARQNDAVGGRVTRELKEYDVIHAAHRGDVGYLKVYAVREGPFGPAYDWRYVYDRSHTELGFVDQFGNAYVYHYFTPFEAATENQTFRLTRLPSDSLENNAMRMLGIDPATDNLTFPEASRATFAAAAQTMPLAGPGIVPPATAPMDKKTPEPAK